MHKAFLGFAVASIIFGTSAHAQLGGVLGKAFGLPTDGEAGGTYQSKNQLRAYLSSNPGNAAALYKKLVVKASDMAKAKGFSRIGVTKTNCSTVFISGSPRSTSCYIIAVMLNDLETTEPRGNRDVQYYNVDDERRRVVAPQPFVR
jgi:hypothetical protein